MIRELEAAGIKMRWDQMSNPGKYGKVVEGPTRTDQDDDDETMDRNVYNEQKKWLNFTRVRATDYKWNTNVYFPKAAPTKQETEIQLKKERFMEVTREVMKEVEEEGNSRTLTKQEDRGLRSLIKRIKENEIVVVETDKSGKFSVMPQQTYLEAGDKHVVEDDEISEEELEKIQKRINAAVSMFIKIFKMGEASKQVERHRGNLINHSSNPSAMKITHKDHKKGEEVHMRRINGPGLNLPLSNLLADMLEPIAGEMTGKVERGSTENVMNLVDVRNEKVDQEKPRWICGEILREVLGGVTGEDKWPTIGNIKNEFQGSVGEEVMSGLDAVGLYPSIKQNVATAACLKAARETKLDIKNVNYLEATRFLVLTMDEKKIQESGLRRVLPRRKKTKDGKKGRKLGLTATNSLQPTTNDTSQWEWAKVNLTAEERREIFARVVEGFTAIFCETQCYTWRGKIYLQKKGLPIGPRATSSIARIVMNEVDQLVGEILEKLDIETELRVRYMDDIRTILRGMVCGATIVGGKLVIDKDLKEQDLASETPAVAATSRFLREVYNSITPGIVYTSETHEEDFPNSWGLPTLDTQWRMKDQVGGGSRLVEYIFFKKEVSSQELTPYRSAQPLNGKVATLSQEVVRILSNCEKTTEKATKMECLEGFCARLNRSGYPVALAARILRSGIMTYQRRRTREDNGGTRIHRPEAEGKDDRRRKKLCGQNKWFRKEPQDQSQLQPATRGDRGDGGGGGGGRGRQGVDATTTKGPSTREVRIAAPLFIPATKEGRLATRLRAEEEILGGQTAEGATHQV